MGGGKKGGKSSYGRGVGLKPECKKIRGSGTKTWGGCLLFQFVWRVGGGGRGDGRCRYRLNRVNNGRWGWKKNRWEKLSFKRQYISKKEKEAQRRKNNKKAVTTKQQQRGEGSIIVQIGEKKRERRENKGGGYADLAKRNKEETMQTGEKTLRHLNSRRGEIGSAGRIRHPWKLIQRRKEGRVRP